MIEIESLRSIARQIWINNGCGKIDPIEEAIDVLIDTVIALNDQVEELESIISSKENS